MFRGELLGVEDTLCLDGGVVLEGLEYDKGDITMGEGADRTKGDNVTKGVEEEEDEEEDEEIEWRAS